MKKQLITILALAAIGTFGVNNSMATDEDISAEDQCQIMAEEQKVAPEDFNQFMEDCLASMEETEAAQEDVEQEQEESEKEMAEEPAKQ